MYVIRKGWFINRLSIKLDTQNAGFYKILEIQGYFYVVDLPAYIKMGNVFYVDRL